MIGATTSRASAARPGWRRRRIPALAGLGLVALIATACGSAASTVTPPAASNSTAPASSQAAFPGVVGTAAAVSGSSMEVQNPTTGQVTVTFTAATAITDTVVATPKDVTVGTCVTVAGQPSVSGSATGPVTATTVTISTPADGNCSATAGFGGAGGGSFSPRPGFSPRPRPSGSSRAFGRANGKVSSLSASGFVVQAKNRATGKDTSITVTTTASTKYLKVVTAHPSALAIGQCITAAGPANNTGMVAARTIRITQPGPNGCVTGVGRGGGFGSSTGGPAGNA
jgi:Domain of unknown function (DUF5666)